jgi:hypothetical protein
MRARLAQVIVGGVVSCRLADVVKKLRAMGEAKLSRELVHRLRRTEASKIFSKDLLSGHEIKVIVAK